MNCEKKSVAKIVKEINERTWQEQSRHVPSPRTLSQKDAMLMKKKDPGTYVDQNTNFVVYPGSTETGGRKTLFFEKIVYKDDSHGTIYNQDTPESCSNLKTPFSISGAERHTAEYSTTKCKKSSCINGSHKNRVTFADNIVTDVFYYEGSADIDDSELSGEISDTVPQSTLNTECEDLKHTYMVSKKQSKETAEKLRSAVAHQRRIQTEISRADASKSSGTSETLFQCTSQQGAISQSLSLVDTKAPPVEESSSKDCEGMQGKKSIDTVEYIKPFVSTDKKHCTEELHGDSKKKNKDTEANHKLFSGQAQSRHGSPDAARVREEIEAIKKNLSIKDLIRMFEIKIKNNMP